MPRPPADPGAAPAAEAPDRSSAPAPAPGLAPDFAPAFAIAVDDPRSPDVTALLREHLADMAVHSPPESRHALDIDGLCRPAITFWSARDGGELLGCGALLELDPRHGEIKSMRTARAHLRRGVAARLLAHIVAEAERRGYARLSLETGSMAAFAPARALYERAGFAYGEPFGAYRPDPNSVFMTRAL